MNKEFSSVLEFTITSAVLEMIISCCVCGSVHEKSEHIYGILDEFNANDLTDNELKEWFMFKSISSKTTFGFTIGGFAPIKKTTIISVTI